MTDPKQQEYEQAVQMLSDDEREKRAEAYHEVQKKKIIPLQEKMNLIVSVQPMVEDEHGDVKRSWHPESRQEYLSLMVEKELLEAEAVDAFWQGYEDLRPEEE